VNGKNQGNISSRFHHSSSSEKNMDPNNRSGKIKLLEELNVFTKGRGKFALYIEK
jgi:hypothetical protein